MLNTCTASALKCTSIGWSAAGTTASSPFPGAATKKSRSRFWPAGVWISMWPPAPGPVSGASTTHDIRTQDTAASTALPPSRSTSAPAAAVSGWPAATTPLMAPMLCASAGQRGALRRAGVGPPHRVALQRERRRLDLGLRATVEDRLDPARGAADDSRLARIHTVEDPRGL